MTGIWSYNGNFIPLKIKNNKLPLLKNNKMNKNNNNNNNKNKNKNKNYRFQKISYNKLKKSKSQISKQNIRNSY